MAHFQEEGKEPELKEELMTETRGGAKVFAANFRIKGGMLSGPVDLHGSRVRSRSVHVSIVTSGRHLREVKGASEDDVGMAGVVLRFLW